MVSFCCPNEWDASTNDLNDANTSWADYSVNTITNADWTNVLKANGAVFLPFTGCREGSSFRYINGGGDYYWSSSHSDNNYSYYMYFGDYLYSSWDYYDDGSRPVGFSVRLVHDVERPVSNLICTLFFRICNAEAVSISICDAGMNDMRLLWYDSPTAQPL